MFPYYSVRDRTIQDAIVFAEKFFAEDEVAGWHVGLVDVEPVFLEAPLHQSLGWFQGPCLGVAGVVLEERDRDCPGVAFLLDARAAEEAGSRAGETVLHGDVEPLFDELGVGPNIRRV
jgi:hypothetical protein